MLALYFSFEYLEKKIEIIGNKPPCAQVAAMTTVPHANNNQHYSNTEVIHDAH